MTRAGPSRDPRLRMEVAICNRKGLHARASAKFVKCADRFDAEVHVSREGQTVGGTSIMGLLMLAARCGDTIAIETAGPDARRALDALAALIGAGFDEDRQIPATQPDDAKPT